MVLLYLLLVALTAGIIISQSTSDVISYSSFFKKRKISFDSQKCSTWQKLIFNITVHFVNYLVIVLK